MVHAAVNLMATSCFAGSWIARGRRCERSGRAVSVVGYAVLLAGGYLGGDLVSRLRVGVDHADRRLRPQRFTTVLGNDQLHERQPVRVEVDGMSIVLVRSGGRIHALGQQCAHQGGPLERGWLQGDTLVCPWHGSAFDLSTGRTRRGPATCPQPVFETRVTDGQIQVRCRPPSPGAPPGSVVASEQEREVTDAGH
jgi:nitrite reductase/ring-hydroxylating ferredoxin subunit